MHPPFLSNVIATIAFLLSSSTTLASPSPHGGPPPRSNITCAKFVIPVTVSANNLILSIPKVNNNSDVINFVWLLDAWSHVDPNPPAPVTFEVNQTFSIGAQLCVPAQAGNGDTLGKSKILQIATHGLVFDKRYWDSEMEPEKYSYVHAAVQAGYSVLTYDRLGTGVSDKPDAYDIVQAPLQVEILAQITRLARSDSLATIARPHFKQVSIPSFTKVVHIGHSYGSILTGGFIAKYPALSDGIIKTAWIEGPHTGDYKQAAFGWQYAAENDPVLFGDRGSGYIVVGTKPSMQQGFLHAPNFDPNLLNFANQIKQPATIGEVLSAGGIVSAPAVNFTGPVQYFLAEYDFLACGGDCKNAYNATQLRGGLYPNASAFDVYIQPGSGHGLVLHNNATAGFQVIFNWLGSNGL